MTAVQAVPSVDLAVHDVRRTPLDPREVLLLRGYDRAHGRRVSSGARAAACAWSLPGRRS